MTDVILTDQGHEAVVRALADSLQSPTLVLYSGRPGEEQPELATMEMPSATIDGDGALIFGGAQGIAQRNGKVRWASLGGIFEFRAGGSGEDVLKFDNPVVGVGDVIAVNSLRIRC